MININILWENSGIILIVWLFCHNYPWIIEVSNTTYTTTTTNHRNCASHGGNLPPTSLGDENNDNDNNNSIILTDATTLLLSNLYLTQIITWHPIIITYKKISTS